MQIVIVGGGIAGLATAVALRSPHRIITVIERSQMLQEVGALISLQPNASKIVSSWGIDSFLAEAKPLIDTALRVLNVHGELVNQIQLNEGDFGSDRVLYHRQDLHTGLLRAAKSDTLPGQPINIITGQPVVSCDPEAGTVVTEDGKSFSADIVIGADGIRSAVRQYVVGESRNPVSTGLSAYRILIPTESLADVAIPEGVIDGENPVTTMVVAQGKRVIMGPGRGGDLVGIVALLPDEQMHQSFDTDSWVCQGSLDSLLLAYQGFPSWITEMFKRAPEIGLWQLRDLEPLPRWVRGRAILIGDAAHAMLPTQGQGASQSIEDAEVLEAFLDELPREPTRMQIQEALSNVFQSRYDRATLVQRYSREQAQPGSKSVMLNPAEFMEFNCRYEGAREWLLSGSSSSRQDCARSA